MYIPLLNMVTEAVAVNMGKPVTTEFVENLVPEMKRVVVQNFSDFCENGRGLHSQVLSF